MEQIRLAQLKQRLIDEKNGILKEMKNNNSFGLDESMNDSIGELSGYDNHPGDIATELYEREKDIGLRENQMHIFDLINLALERIEEGTYGKCKECHQEIPLERLEALPYARFCIEHQPNDEISLKRPIEEELMSPPFGRLSFDGRDDETEFDAEDSWQAVARYGTSDSADYFRDGSDYNDMYIEGNEPIGYVEPLEGFIITDIDGNPSEGHIDIARNAAYEDYIAELELGEEEITERDSKK